MAVAGSPRGQPSIDVYNLNRSDRLQRRRQHIQTLMNDIERFKPFVPAADQEAFVTAYLQERADSTAEYSAVAHSMLRDPAAFGLG